MDYEMLYKYQGREGDIEEIRNFLAWLEDEKGIRFDRFFNERDLILEYMGIDKVQLEKERRALLAEQRSTPIDTPA